MNIVLVPDGARRAEALDEADLVECCLCGQSFLLGAFAAEARTNTGERLGDVCPGCVLSDEVTLLGRMADNVRRLRRMAEMFEKQAAQLESLWDEPVSFPPSSAIASVSRVVHSDGAVEMGADDEIPF